MDDADVLSFAEKPRTLARRRQVLAAAAACFRRHGFHACSMAQISTEAGMSVGHIYRYFPGKDAIIATIVRSEVDEMLLEMTEFPLHPSDPHKALIQSFERAVLRSFGPGQPPLLVEIRAEAARNPKIAELVREADARIFGQLSNAIQLAVGRNLDCADLTARAEMFHIIFHGLIVFTAGNLEIDRSALMRRVVHTIESVLE